MCAFKESCDASFAPCRFLFPDASLICSSIVRFWRLIPGKFRLKALDNTVVPFDWLRVAVPFHPTVRDLTVGTPLIERPREPLRSGLHLHLKCFNGMSEYLFTYGTLQPGLAPSEVAPEVDKLLTIGEGSVPGLLYNLGHFPGAVLDPDSKHRIFGTVFQLPEDKDVLRKLDSYEEFNPDRPDESQFLRTRHSVELVSGHSIDCWVYVYNQKPDTGSIIESGRFQKEPAP